MEGIDLIGKFNGFEKVGRVESLECKRKTATF